MARRASALSSTLKYFFPSYYLRRPRRLGFISLLFVAAVFFFMDRQNQHREIEAMSTQIHQLEGEKAVLVVELNKLRNDGQAATVGVDVQQQQQDKPLLQQQGTQADEEMALRRERLRADMMRRRKARGGGGGDPLILGVGAGAARKLLPRDLAERRAAMIKMREERVAAAAKAAAEAAAAGGGSAKQAEGQQAQEQQQQQQQDSTAAQQQGAGADSAEKASEEQTAADGGEARKEEGAAEGGGDEGLGENNQSDNASGKAAEDEAVRKEMERVLRQVEKKDEGEGGSGGSEDEAVRRQQAVMVAEQRRESVRKGMEHAWASYKKYAWGADELQPQSRNGANDFGGLGATIIDSLDTLFIMGLMDQFKEARDWVAENLHFNIRYTASVFETTIRVLGGLLSAYDLSGDDMFLTKARELADRLMPAWQTPSGVPYQHLELSSGQGQGASWAGGATTLADAGTTQLEMVALTQRTNDSKYARASENVMTQIQKVYPEDGLVPCFISPNSGRFTTNHVTFGAMGDSFFEYLVKLWVQGGKTEVVQRYRDMWDKSINGMLTKLVKRTGNGLTYVAESHGSYTDDKMDHLGCFAGGMLVLGMEGAQPDKAEEYLKVAKELGHTCYEFYASQPSKLSGESYHFNAQGMYLGTGYNILRPETVETLFYLWRKTKDPVYREWGWNIWQAFEKNCKLPSGYTGLTSVASDPPPKDNKMQSFFLAETLKYLYLLFSPDDVIPLDQWVFNTEAHPIRIKPRHEPFVR